MPPFHFTPEGETLTAASARQALFLWLRARQRSEPFLLARQPAADSELWREELRWLGLESDGEAEKGDTPDWLRSLPALEESEPSPWGQWSGRTSVAELRELGVLPEALLNFLALTAWTPPPDPRTGKPREILSREEIGRASCRERV